MWKSRRAKRKVLPKVRLIKLLILIFILAVASLLFFTVSKFRLLEVLQITVVGSQVGCVSENQIQETAALQKQNFFTLDVQKIAKKLQDKFYCVKDINLSRSFPNKVEIKVTGRQPVAVLATLQNPTASLSALIANIATPSARNIEGLYIIDKEGVVFAKAEDNLNIPQILALNLKISLGEKLTKTTAGCLIILDKIKELGIEVKESWIIDNYFIINSSQGRPRIIFNLNNNVDVQLASLQLILDKAKINGRTIPDNAGKELKELEFIDLRFDKPVVKFVPQKKN